jgi:hypothetical protein
MRRETTASAPYEWQREANDLLGANLVGDVCGKKTKNQAYRWARDPVMAEAQNGPLMHVMQVCSRLVEAGGLEGREIALSAARMLCVHLSSMGLPVRLAVDSAVVPADSASLSSQRLLRAASDAVQAGVDGKPSVLVAANTEFLMQSALEFQALYAQEYAGLPEGGRVRFTADLPLGPGRTAARVEQVLQDRSLLKACFKAIWKWMRGK